MYFHQIILLWEATILDLFAVYFLQLSDIGASVVCNTVSEQFIIHFIRLYVVEYCLCNNRHFFKELTLKSLCSSCSSDESIIIIKSIIGFDARPLIEVLPICSIAIIISPMQSSIISLILIYSLSLRIVGNYFYKAFHFIIHRIYTFLSLTMIITGNSLSSSSSSKKPSTTNPFSTHNRNNSCSDL